MTAGSTQPSRTGTNRSSAPAARPNASAASQSRSSGIPRSCTSHQARIPNVSDTAETSIRRANGTNAGSSAATPTATAVSARGRGSPRSTQSTSAAKKSGAT